ncbi:MAG: Hsp20/alpha crystallin family protein [Pseudomonadota bacterium]
MTNLRYQQPWTLMHQLQNELGNALDARFPRYQASNTDSAVSADWVPAVDVREEDGRYVLRADLPGVKADDIQITTESGTLTLSGTRETRAAKDEGYRKVERVAGKFYRRFSLPETANADQIEATSSNGVLEISIPKQPEVQPRRIDVRVQ